ncbi:hypothetical protein U9M48_001316 [Paspalum notatum var. saurae]|uniref:Uncharacterized protein n=1 Tax=Paspalum notatum var. saurae TaxID=547442 RepID=A0AAQ3PNG7_PASNO
MQRPRETAGATECAWRPSPARSTPGFDAAGDGGQGPLAPPRRGRRALTLAPRPWRPVRRAPPCRGHGALALRWPASLLSHRGHGVQWPRSPAPQPWRPHARTRLARPRSRARPSPIVLLSLPWLRSSEALTRSRAAGACASACAAAAALAELLLRDLRRGGLLAPALAASPSAPMATAVTAESARRKAGGCVPVFPYPPPPTSPTRAALTDARARRACLPERLRGAGGLAGPPAPCCAKRVAGVGGRDFARSGSSAREGVAPRRLELGGMNRHEGTLTSVILVLTAVAPVFR